MASQKSESIYVKAGRLFFILVFVYAVCFVSSLFITRDRLNWYRSLPLSSLTPPDYLFGVAWSILYLLMGISAFLVWNKASPRYFALQLICAGLWPFVFFFLHSIIGGLIIIALMIVFLGLTIKTFYPVSKTAGILLIPQLVWAIFAFYLNASLLIG